VLVGVLKSLEAGEYVKLTPKPHEGNTTRDSKRLTHLLSHPIELKLTSEGVTYSEKGTPEAQVFGAIAEGADGSPMADVMVLLESYYLYSLILIIS
jgi:hypothetical protein